MSKREKVLELLESTSGCDKSLERIIREEWNIELMKDSLDLLKEIYQRLKEKYENPPSDGSYDLDMIKLLSDKLTAIGYWRWKLDDPITQQFLPELKEDIVRTIEAYYRFITKSIEEDEEATA